ncbi:putative F-box domain-containing protein [Tanacetum coccineum]
MHNGNLLKNPNLKDQNLLFFSQETFFTIDCESLPIKAPCPHPLPQFKASPPQYMSILTSYHGLVCLRIFTHDYQDNYIILWNPMTTEYKRLSKPSNPDHMECYNLYGSGYGLYYSSCEDDYKLLVVTVSGNVYIYSLKSDSWRKLNKRAPCQEEWNWTPGFRLSENIYFQCYNIARGLIRFDTTAERFHKIETPPEYDNTYHPRFATTVHRGSVHLCVKYNTYGRTGFMKSTCIEMWKLNADGDIWSKVVTYQLGPNDVSIELDEQRKLAHDRFQRRRSYLSSRTKEEVY